MQHGEVEVEVGTKLNDFESLSEGSGRLGFEGESFKASLLK